MRNRENVKVGTDLNNNYKALFLDMDGTILRHDHSISSKTKEAISIVQEKGIEVFLATGRPIHEIRETAEELGIDSFIGYNGALGIYKGDVLFEKPMSSKIIDHYLQVAHSIGNEMVLYTDSFNLFTNLQNDKVKEFIHYFGLVHCKEFEQTYRSQILGVTLINVEDDAIREYEIENEDIYFAPVNVDGMGHCFDVIRNQVNKGVAIQHILNRLNVSTSQAIAFGDGLNDIQMLRTVGAGFAMDNAHPDLFPYATHKTKSVEDEGVFYGLQSLGLV